jgi:methylmalonyl-CoA mutase
VSRGMPAVRLSTAFDSVTLYGEDPDRAARHLRQGRQQRRVDRHVDDAKKLYSGFDLSTPRPRSR